MLQIPSLTARELDIAPLLIANATRNEIARHLGISEETVKHHTRNILRKFEATNIRDAYEALSDHLYVFGKDGLNLNYFYRSFTRNLYLSENRIDALVEDTVVLEAIYRPMTEFVSEYYTTSGKVENIRVDGEPFDVHERVGVNTASTKIIDPALQPSETITVKKTADYVGVFPENIEWLSVLVAQPIGTINYWVHFNGDDLPAHVWEHVAREMYIHQKAPRAAGLPAKDGAALRTEKGRRGLAVGDLALRLRALGPLASFIKGVRCPRSRIPGGLRQPAPSKFRDCVRAGAAV